MYSDWIPSIVVHLLKMKGGGLWKTIKVCPYFTCPHSFSTGVMLSLPHLYTHSSHHEMTILVPGSRCHFWCTHDKLSLFHNWSGKPLKWCMWYGFTFLYLLTQSLIHTWLIKGLQNHRDKKLCDAVCVIFLYFTKCRWNWEYHSSAFFNPTCSSLIS